MDGWKGTETRSGKGMHDLEYGSHHIYCWFVNNTNVLTRGDETDRGEVIIRNEGGGEKASILLPSSHDAAIGHRRVWRRAD